MTIGKTVALTIQTFVGKMMFLLFNMLSRFIIAFLQRSKNLLIFTAAITVLSDFGRQENKACHCFHCFPIYLPWSDGTWCHDLSFLNVESQAKFSLSFTLNKRLFSSLSLSFFSIRLTSAYLESLIFLLEILIPACDSSRLTFLMMYSAYKLNKQGDNMHPWCTPFPIFNQSIVPCPVLIVASLPTHKFLSRQIRWAAIPNSLRTFHSLLWSIQRL